MHRGRGKIQGRERSGAEVGQKMGEGGIGAQRCWGRRLTGGEQELGKGEVGEDKDRRRGWEQEKEGQVGKEQELMGTAEAGMICNR